MHVNLLYPQSSITSFPTASLAAKGTCPFSTSPFITYRCQPSTSQHSAVSLHHPHWSHRLSHPHMPVLCCLILSHHFPLLILCPNCHSHLPVPPSKQLVSLILLCLCHHPCHSGPRQRHTDPTTHFPFIV